MKKIYLLSAMVLAGLFANKAEAQISIHIGLNIPPRPVYVPAPQPVVYDDVFDDSDDYYYLPEVEAYYSIPLHCYFYNDGSRWIRAQYLPGAYRNYDWRTARRFEVRGRRPYMNHDVYRGRWGGNPYRGDWNRRNNDYANRGDYGRNNGGNWGRNDDRGRYGRNDNRGWGDRNDNRGSWGRGKDRDDDRNKGGYNQPDRNQGGGRGGWGGQNGQQQYPQQPSNGGNQGGQHGGWGGQQGGGQQQQPSQPSNNGGQHGGWGGQQGGGNQNGGGGQDRGNRGGGQIAQNDRPSPRQGGFMRPGRF
ncbi:hypothetical protein [Mucilaginibacter pedocola]|uniref:DUF3300 domain-containing protein n=1 Tax=Mucilaginibacter pedocola TaxID=1792845 RepID=A0A1S9PM39_9SPHI|nr:hypothetical protein [Mucilaginibacter pedocola]OOQ61628.1 hypothetical protein BC343_00700 [Mucilaginibacter pedocola]